MTDNEIAEKELLKIDKWNYESAIESLTAILELNITDTKLLKDIYARRAFYYRFLELYENAIEDYSKVFDLQLKLNESPYYYKRAVCFQNTGQYLNAIEDYSNSKNIVYEGRAYCYEQIGETDKAILDYKQGIIKYTEEIEEYGNDDDVVGMSYMSRGDCHKGLKEWKNAIRDYESASNSGLFIAECDSKIGDCYIKLNDYENAVRNYDCAIYMLKDECSIYVRPLKDIFDKHSVVCQKLGRYEEAKNDMINSDKLKGLLRTCKSTDYVMQEVLSRTNNSIMYKSTKGRKLDL